MNSTAALATAKILGAVVTLLATYLTVKQTAAILDNAKQKLIDEQRAPTHDEIEALMQEIEAN